MEIEVRKKIGERLRRLRRQRDITQKELSMKVGIDYSYIGKIERGEQLPSIKLLLRLSNLLRTDLSYFFEDDSLLSLLEYTPEEMKALADDENKRVFIRLLKEIDEEDIPFIIEILRILKEHRKRLYMPERGLLKVAEPTGRPYNKRF